MKKVKRVEIVIDAVHAPLLLEVLRNAGSNDYTMLRDVQGVGDRGERLGDALTDALENSYVLVACSPESLSNIVDVIRPLLKEHGGLCLVSDAEWLKH